MNYINERPLVSGLVIGLIVGILIGWLGIGWGVWPVEYQDAHPAFLRADYRAEYVGMVAESYHLTGDQDLARERMQGWTDGAEYACQMANDAADVGEKQKLQVLALVLSPQIDCGAVGTAAVEEEVPPTAEAAEEQGTSLGVRIAQVCGLVLLAGLLVGGGFFLIQRRRAAGGEGGAAMPTAGPSVAVGAPEVRAIPLAQFPTEFNIGHDTYDDSFSIETASGEFLGECGVGISESIGVGDPKKVTAFEVWLFDKNDIRTITKVIMSEHAYYDDALRAKLAPKGEAALAKPGEIIVLETASLIINARVVEMEYGTGELPPQSFFNRLVIELAAWAKEGEDLVDLAPAGGGADDFAL
jgi:hypothetical protein